jgi:hypothetical protein
VSTVSARVTFTRTSAEDVGQRQVNVRVDNGPTMRLLHGEAMTLDLEPGEHIMRADNTLIWKRVPFIVAPGEHVTFLLVNRASRWTLGFLAVMGVAPLKLTIERVDRASGGPGL